MSVTHKKVITVPATQERINAPIVTTVTEKPIVDQIEEKVNVIVHKQQVITEIVEQPVIELHETREVKHVREKSVLGEKVVESTVYQDLGVENKLTESQKRAELELALKAGQIDRKAYEEQLREIVVAEEALLKRIEYQPIIEKHNQTLVKEVHERNIHQVVEQPVTRRVYEKPIIRRVVDGKVVEYEDESTVARDVQVLKHDVTNAAKKVVNATEQKLESIGEEIKHDAKVVKQEANKKGLLRREFLLPLGLFAAAAGALFLYNNYYATPVVVATSAPKSGQPLLFETPQRSAAFENLNKNAYSK
ncbi:hypothetical protein AKO1_003525 [Acrasis kona]|uniref:DUF2382 domain-containing protein n=1 Tax=Acrasis kona TaxID=1008807 RepID=A0AAW2YGN3_9EUKA